MSNHSKKAKHKLQLEINKKRHREKYYRALHYIATSEDREVQAMVAASERIYQQMNFSG